MNSLFDNLIVSSPNGGGLFLAARGRAFQLDHINSTGIYKAANMFLRGHQPSSLWMFNDQTFEVVDNLSKYDDIHDVLCHGNKIYVVGTQNNEIIEADERGVAIRSWVFDGEDDSCHINCLGVWNDRIVFSAFGEFKNTREYKNNTAGTGYVQDLVSGKRLVTGLSQPHSLIAFGDNLLLTNSEEMEVREYSPSGDMIRVRKLEGYTRGICVSRDVIYVGLSGSRNVIHGDSTTATLVALDSETWDEIGRLPLPVNEIYSIIYIADVHELLNIVATVAADSSVKYRKQIEDSSLTIFEQKKNLDNALTERDAAVASLKEVKDSKSWHITSPLRFAGRLYRYGLINEDRQRISQAIRSRYHRLPLPEPVKRLVGFAYHKGLLRSLRIMRRRLFRAPMFHAPEFFPVEQKAGLPDYIVWGVVDWHFRYQRPQQLARALASTGRRVFYISPELLDDERTGFEVEALDDSGLLFQINLFVKNAPVIYTSIPGLETVAQLRLSVGELLNRVGCWQIVSLVQHPYWFDVASVLPNSRLVYDCMDHHEGFGNTASALLQQEKALLIQAELTITTSTWLEQAVASHARRRVLIRNAADYDFFSKQPKNIYAEPQGRRIIGYYGAIAEWFDLDLVEAVAKQHPECCILLIGADTINARGRFGKLHNVTFTGEVPYTEIPYYLYSFDICLLPFKVIPLTVATNPVKAYEYLSAGKPVIAVDLPEMGQFDGLINIAASKKQFLAEVNTVLMQSETEDMIKSRKIFAAGQTWLHRTEELVEHAESTSDDPMVSVVVVTYNNLELTKACLISLDEYSLYTNLEIIVVDNASSDESPVFLQAWVANNHNRKLILNEDNRGFAAANNQGLAIASGDYLVMLNNDTYVTPGWILTLSRHLRRDKTLGLIGPVTNNIGNEAKIDIAYEDMTGMLIKSAAYTNRHVGQVYPLRTAAFFCVMMSRETYAAVGPLDEVFGRGFFEDDDYCRRIEAHGLRVVCAEDVFIHHELSASFNKLKQKDRQKLFEENKKIYEAKWGEWIHHGYRKAKRPALPEITISQEFDNQKHVTGQCVVCGKHGRFFYQEIALWRESLNCEHCLTTSRYRSITQGILRAINELTGEQASSLADLPLASNRKLHVYDTQPPFYYETCAYPLPDLLKATGWIDVELSQYRPTLPMGEVLTNGVTNQNLECLTFDDASLDLLITSDVMGHVHLDDHAHREIYRVLKPGGIYIFTVPHNRDSDETLVRVQVTAPEDPSKDVHLLEPENHGDTNSDEGNGVLSYRVYGRNLDDYLSELGFEVEYSKDDIENMGILNTELYYCRKTAG